MSHLVKSRGPAGTRSLVLFILLAVCLASPGESWGEDATLNRAAAAGALFDAGDYPAAAAAFEAAYKADPRPEYLYNLAQCHLRVKDLPSLEKAGHALRAYLRHKPKAKNRAQVEEEIAEVDERIKVLRAQRPTEPAALNNILLIPEAQAAEPVPIYKKWWLWTAVGVVVAGAVTTAVVLTAPKEIHTEQGTLSPGTIHFD